jgi:4-aminobutyrate aminotransferase-like enzyme
MFGEFGDRAQFLQFPYVFRSLFPGNSAGTEEHCVRELARLFEHEYTGAWNPRTRHSEFGALFLEPVQGTGGYVIPPRGYFKRVAAICRDHGILIVDDEIQMGFYRTGTMWALEHFDVQPDIIVFGKALTNGMNPLSGIWAREELIAPSVFGPGSTHSTFASNTLGTAAGLEVMRLLQRKDYGSIVPEKGRWLLAGLRELASRHPEIGEVDGLGLALRMEMCERDGRTPSRRLADRMFQIGLEGDLVVGGETIGLVLDIGGYYKNVITLAPSLEISESEIAQALSSLEAVLICAKAELAGTRGA